MKRFRTSLCVFLVTGICFTLPSCAQKSSSDPDDRQNAELPEGMNQAENDPSGIQWLSLEDAQVKAVETGKKVLIFGYADWCTYCMKMRRETYPQDNVQEALYADFIPVQLNAESEQEVKFNGETYASWELARYLRLSSFPTHYFINPDGEILGAQPGFLPSEIFAPLMSYIGEDQFGKVKFEDYLLEKENIVIDQEGGE